MYLVFCLFFFILQDVLEIVDAIISADSGESWEFLNANAKDNKSSSSLLLGSLESLSNALVGEFSIATERIILNRTTFSNNFNTEINSSVVIDIPSTGLNNVSITTITLPTFNIVLPARDSSFDPALINDTNNEDENAINAAVVVITVTEKIQNVSLSFNKLNSSLRLDPQCVFWNFTLFDELGAWDDSGCFFVSDINNTVTCTCNHLTSFSFLMATDIPEHLKVPLQIITYVGVGISLASLVICLIIEGFVWKAVTRNSTAFMRHVAIVNTAVSLLIADICFIVAASLVEEDQEVPIGPCSATTFFMHFFYLALFFWMLVSGLFLFYRTVMVLSHMAKSTMLAIGFSLGYGCPVIIAVVTVAVTAPGKGYVRGHGFCWLNWFKTKALLAMVIPALAIVFINILILFVVLFKMLRRGIGSSAPTDEKHTLAVIARCVIILTPLFGLTWALGIGTMLRSDDEGIHIAFAFFNSLQVFQICCNRMLLNSYLSTFCDVMLNTLPVFHQGFFILVFGTLLDSKVC